MDKLEAFHPDRMASRILGMGDLLSLIEKAEQVADLKESEEMARRLRREEFTLEDFLKQIQQLRKMGALSGLLSHLPGSGPFKQLASAEVDDRKLVHFEAIIRSMTPRERANEKLIDGSRRRRIALGSGRPIQEVNQLLKQFSEIKRMVRKPGFKKMMSRGLP